MQVDQGHHQAYSNPPGELAGCATLWAEVMRMAFNDACGAITRPNGLPPARWPVFERNTRIEARQWFASEERCIGSFLWICGFLELDPRRVRAAQGAAASLGHAMLGQTRCRP